MIKICIVQQKPAYLDLPASMAKLEEIVTTAAANDARLIVFGETWLTGYPKWLDLVPDLTLWDHEPAREVYTQMWNNSITVPGEETKQISTLARNHQVIIGLGINEKVVAGPGNKTLFNTFLLVDDKGEIGIHHRKLMPTYTEKLLYGLGDASGLKSTETSIGRISGLICWEHWMPLPRQVLHTDGEHIHLALWPWVHEMHQIASRHYAFEGRCFVLAAGQIMSNSDIPEAIAVHPQTTDELILRGGSCVIGPDGKFITGPVFDQETLVYATLDMEKITREQMTLSTAGHYSRPDIFDLHINKKRP